MPAVDWVVPTVQDLGMVLSYELQAVSNENIRQDLAVAAAAPYDPAQPDRRAASLQLAVQEFRGAIRVGNRVPLSETEGSVPPELERVVLCEAAYNLVTSALNLKTILVTAEGGVYAPFNRFKDEAQKEIARLRAGGIVSTPNDPETGGGDTGEADSIDGLVDMTTDGPTTVDDDDETT